MEPIQQPALNFDESIKQVMQTLPPAIRTYLAQGKYSIVASSLMTKYSLHVDQGGILEREIMLLLMGIDDPSDFGASLKDEAKIPENIVSNIMTDVNAQIFVPLREEMRKGPQAAQQAPKPAAPRPAQHAGGYRMSTSQPARPTAQMAGNEPFAPRHPAYVKPSQPVRNPDLRNVLASVTKEVQPAKLLEDHEEPHIEFHPTSPTATKGAEKPQPPANLPGMIQPSVPPPSVSRPAPTSAPIRHSASTVPYSDDPYREPIDEK